MLPEQDKRETAGTKFLERNILARGKLIACGQTKISLSVASFRALMPQLSLHAVMKVGGVREWE